jgi:hypothetical protein
MEFIREFEGSRNQPEISERFVIEASKTDVVQREINV